jgi:hypothetical protein
MTVPSSLQAISPRKCHRPAAAATLVWMLTAGTAGAAIIHADGATCTLVQAVHAANGDAPAGGCAAGSGADTIVLGYDVILTAVDNDTEGPNGLPSVTSMITIKGRNHAIERSGATSTPAFRLLHVSAAGSLTVDAARLQNGLVSSGSRGGALFNLGVLKLTRSTISGNRATLGTSFEAAGGGLYNGGTLTLSHTAVSDNTAEGGTFSQEGISRGSGAGGGLYNDGTATLTHSAVLRNFATVFQNFSIGGGIYNNGTVTLVHTRVANNGAVNTGGSVSGGGDGGGIYGGTVALTHSVVSENNSDFSGGGISANTVTLTHSTVSGNTSEHIVGSSGGGISAGTVTLIDSTVSGNSAGGGGGIEAGTVTLTNSTVSNNSANIGGGGGIRTSTLVLTHGTVSGNSALPRSEGFPGGGGLLFDTGTFTNSLVADNTGGDCVFPRFDPAGTVTTAGLNLIEDGSCGSSFPANTDPRLGALMDNGGPTQTQALLAGSPAIDQIAFVPGTGCEATSVKADQRGVRRPQPPGGRCDLGAFERGQTPSALFGQIIDLIDQLLQRILSDGDADALATRGLDAVREQLLLADDLMEQGKIGLACGQLATALAADPVKAPAAAGLVYLIEDLRNRFGCTQSS